MRHTKNARACHALRASISQTIEPLESRLFLSITPAQPTALTGIFQTTAQLSQLRTAIATVKDGDDVLFAGGLVTTGSNKSVPSDVVDIYNARTGQWSVTHLPEPTINPQTLVVGNDVFFMGGNPAAVAVYNIVTRQWSQALTGNNPSYKVVGSNVVFFGGSSGARDYRLSSLVAVFDTTNNQWSTTTLPQARSGTAQLVVGTKLMIAGGWIDDGNGTFTLSAAVNIYDVATNQWSTASLSQARGFITASLSGDTAIFDDGYVAPDPTDDAQSKSDVVDLYNSTTGQWTATTDGDPAVQQLLVDQSTDPASVQGDKLVLYNSTTGVRTQVDIPPDYAPTYGLGSAMVFATLGDKVIIGTNNPYGNVTRIDIYNESTGQWSGHDLHDAHADNVVVAGKLVFAGTFYGDGGPEASDLVETYDPVSDSWTTTTLPEPADPIGDDSVFENKLFLQGEKTLYAYDPADGSVTPLPLSSGNFSYGLISDDDQLLSLDNSSPDVSKTVDVFSPTAIGEPTDQNITDGVVLTQSPAAFSWAASQGASSYDVYLDDQLVANVSAPTWTADRLIPTGNHSWQVVARNGGNITAGPRWQFTVGPAVAPSGPNVTPGASLSVSPTVFSWNPSAGATGYKLYLDGVRFERNTPFNSVTLSEPVIGGQHTWTVVALNGLGNVRGPTWTFSTPASNLRHTSKPLETAYDNYTTLTVGDLALFVPAYAENIDPVLLYNGTTDEWSSIDALAAMDKFAIATVGTKAFFVGGEVGFNGPATDVVSVIDLLTGRHRAAHLSQARENLQAVSLGTIAAFAGGTYAGKHERTYPSDVVDLYDDRTATWSTAKLSQPRVLAATATAGTKILFAGGAVQISPTGEHDVLSDVVDIYDTATGNWSVAHLSAPAEQLLSFSVGKRAYFIGKGVMDVYDASTGQWASAAVPADISVSNYPRTPFAVLGTHVYFGATDSTAASGGQAEILDTRTGRWSGAALNGPPAVVTVAGQKILFAGESTDVVDVFDTAAGQWSVQKMSAAESPFDIGATAGVSLGDTAIFRGEGYNYHDHEIFTVADRYLDPTAPLPVLSGAISASSTVARGVRMNVRVSHSNIGAGDFAGPYTVDLYASPDATIDDNAVLVGRAIMDQPLVAGGDVTVTISAFFPKTLPAGHYHLFAAARGLGGDLTKLDEQLIRLLGSGAKI